MSGLFIAYPFRSLAHHIEQLADDCRATIIHSMDARWAEWVEQTVKGSASMLTAIDSYLSSN